MNEHRAISAALDADTIALVEELAGARGVSTETFVAEAVRRVAESEGDFRAFVQIGIDQADRGETVPHDEVMAELDGMIARHRTRCA